MTDPKAMTNADLDTAIAEIGWPCGKVAHDPSAIAGRHHDLLTENRRRGREIGTVPAPERPQQG